MGIGSEAEICVVMARRPVSYLAFVEYRGLQSKPMLNGRGQAALSMEHGSTTTPSSQQPRSRLKSEKLLKSFGVCGLGVTSCLSFSPKRVCFDCQGPGGFDRNGTPSGIPGPCRLGYLTQTTGPQAANASHNNLTLAEGSLRVS